MRAAAAWTLATLDTRSDAGGEILALLEAESNPLVRKRLYQALANQDSFDVNAAWAQTVAESESGARIAGMELIARTVQQSDSAEMIAFFDQHFLPELKEAALHAGSTDERVASTMALRRSRTPHAAAALREIAAQTHDLAVVAVSGVKAPSNVAR